MHDCSKVSTPLEIGKHLAKWTEDQTCIDATQYRQMVGSLMYLMIGTWPDIVAAISIVSQFASEPTKDYFHAIKRILRYLQGTKGYKLNLGGEVDSIKLTGYSDSDWANDISTRKSISGYLFYLADGVVSWSSKRQMTVALSSTEAEYIAISHATKEAL